MATPVVVPPLGTNVDTVTLVSWHRHEGDEVASGEPLFAVETDKAVLDVESPARGILRGVSASEGEEVPALSAIAWICAEGEAPPISAGSVHPHQPCHVSHDVLQPVHSPEAPRRFASPWARMLARDRGLDWTILKGSGPMGAVVARDVEAARPAPRSPATPLARRVALEAGTDMSRIIGTGHLGRITCDDVLRGLTTGHMSANGDAEPSPLDAPVETFALTGIRGRIAERMHRGAHDTASVTLTTEVDATRLVEARKRLMADGLRITYNDMLMHIVARSLMQHPRMNAVYEGDRAVVRRSTDIALAVDTERGLLAPVVRGVQALSLSEIAAATSSIIERARSGRITPDELHGSTFTITNLGMLGIDAFTPIINVPECAILGVGRIKPTPWVADDRVVVRQAMWLSLTFDHRIVDGGPAARFLQSVARAIEAGG